MYQMGVLVGRRRGEGVFPYHVDARPMPPFLLINQICVTNLFYLSLEETWIVKMTQATLKNSYMA
jgi:hypothetical protein